MKKSAGIVLGAVCCVAVAAAAVFYKNYDEWFTFPPLRKIISAQLKDPVSAQFRNERISRLGWLCGELNTKNGMGGYVGFKRYIVSGSGEAYLQGHGYIGPERGQSTQQIIDEMTVKIETMERLNKMVKDGAIPASLTASQIDELTQQAIFDKKWSQVCEIT